MILFLKKDYNNRKYKTYKKVRITMTNIMYQTKGSNTYRVKGHWTSYNIKLINLITTKFLSLYPIANSPNRKYPINSLRKSAESLYMDYTKFLKIFKKL